MLVKKQYSKTSDRHDGIRHLQGCRFVRRSILFQCLTFPPTFIDLAADYSPSSPLCIAGEERRLPNPINFSAAFPYYHG